MSKAARLKYTKQRRCCFLCCNKTLVDITTTFFNSFYRIIVLVNSCCCVACITAIILSLEIMDRGCPMLGVLTSYLDHFDKCVKMSSRYISDEDPYADFSPEPPSAPFSVAPSNESDEESELLSDAEHEYRLRLRMLQYRQRYTPGNMKCNPVCHDSC